MKEAGAVHLTFEESNRYTAHAAHQSERDAQKKIAAASNTPADDNEEPDADDAMNVSVASNG